MRLPSWGLAAERQRRRLDEEGEGKWMYEGAPAEEGLSGRELMNQVLWGRWRSLRGRKVRGVEGRVEGLRGWSWKRSGVRRMGRRRKREHLGKMGCCCCCDEEMGGFMVGWVG